MPLLFWFSAAFCEHAGGDSMADILRNLFSAAPGLHRVNISGLIVMLVGAILLLVSGAASARFAEEKRENAKIILKLVSLVICVAGFAIALY
jgi:hypothetical protein